MRLIDTLLLLAAGTVLIPVAVFCAECLLALVPRRLRRETGARPPAIVLIPAHDEETGIERTLRTLLPTLAAADRVLVVADNCTDRTAAVARGCGAEVVERTNPTRRGKGYALEFGLAHVFAPPLRKGGPGGVTSESIDSRTEQIPDGEAVIVFLDADCQVTPDTVDQLARAAARTHRPVQGLNLSEAERSGVQAVSSLGFHFKNLVRPSGLARIGMPCHLMGTGMALPWELARRGVSEVAEDPEEPDFAPPLRKGGPAFDTTDFPTGTCSEALGANLVEDMQLGVDLAIAGTPALFCPTALVTSRLPAGKKAFLSQRTRWEHGHLRTSLTQIPRLARAFLRSGDLRLLALALDLTVPPFSMLLFACAGIWVASLVVGACGGSWTPAALVTGGGVAVAASVLGGWVKFCRSTVPLVALAAIPAYMCRKIPIYLSFLARRSQRAWVRTERETLG